MKNNYILKNIAIIGMTTGIMLSNRPGSLFADEKVNEDDLLVIFEEDETVSESEIEIMEEDMVNASDDEADLVEASYDEDSIEVIEEFFDENPRVFYAGASVPLSIKVIPLLPTPSLSLSILFLLTSSFSRIFGTSMIPAKDDEQVYLSLTFDIVSKSGIMHLQGISLIWSAAI